MNVRITGDGDGLVLIETDRGGGFIIATEGKNTQKMVYESLLDLGLRSVRCLTLSEQVTDHVENENKVWEI